MSSRWYFIVALIILAVELVLIALNMIPGGWQNAVAAIIVAFLILLGLKQP